jgi:hypothetical protein
MEAKTDRSWDADCQDQEAAKQDGRNDCRYQAVKFVTIKNLGETTRSVRSEATKQSLGRGIQAETKPARIYGA